MHCRSMIVLREADLQGRSPRQYTFVPALAGPGGRARRRAPAAGRREEEDDDEEDRRWPGGRLASGWCGEDGTGEESQ